MNYVINPNPPANQGRYPFIGRYNPEPHDHIVLFTERGKGFFLKSTNPRYQLGSPAGPNMDDSLYAPLASVTITAV